MSGMAVARRQVLALVAGAVSVVPATTRTAAQLPARQIRLVVPFPPGGPTDAAARIVAEALRSSDGPPVLVENKAGAAGTIGARQVRDAPPDGRTLLIGNNQTHATAPFLIKDAGYDPVDDFTPIGAIGSFAHVLVVRKDLAATTFAELAALAEAKPGRVTYGSTGVGSGSHLAMEMLAARASLQLQHVPYQGAAQMVGDIAAGRLDASLAILPSVLPLVEAGAMRALVVAGAERVPALDRVPTLSEMGLGGAESESWLALFGPKGMPDERVRRIEEMLARNDRGGIEMGRRLRALGIEPVRRPAEHFRVYHRSEIDRWRRTIETLGLKPQ